MGKLAFLYPGQGSQKVGMGAELRELRPELYNRYLGLANETSGLPVQEFSLDGPAEGLTETNVAQPALFALSLALTEVARDVGLQPAVVAGHSLGEYTAAVAAGALSLDDGMQLVSLRGRLMAGAQSERPGGMAAVIGLEADTLEELCRQASEAGPVAPANYNTPTQTVVSGDVTGVERLMALAEGAGAQKIVRLQVGAAFHSELMRPTQARMAESMESVAWSDPEVPLASNAAGELVTTGEQVHQALIDQIASPVRWVECVRALADSGVTTYLELGSGRVLTGLVRQILGADAAVHAADSPAKLEEFVAAQPARSGG